MADPDDAKEKSPGAARRLQRLIMSDNDDEKPQRPSGRRRCRAASSDDSDASSSSEGTSSSSSRTSDDDSDSSTSSEIMVRGKAVKVVPRRVAARPKAKASDSSKPAARVPTRKRARPNTTTVRNTNDSSDDAVSNDEDDEDQMRHVVVSRKGQRDKITELIARILCRWWYVLPDWPPPNYDYSEALRKRNLKLVSLEEWEAADDVDEAGFTKVYQIAHFEGVFRDPKGAAIDLRPLENKPCYSTFKNYAEVELYELLVKALTTQLGCIGQSPYRNTEQPTLDRLKAELKEELRAAQTNLARLKRKQPESAKTSAPDTPA